MADRRIRYDKSRTAFVNSLWSEADSTGPFSTKVDLLCFAASYAASKNSSSSVKTPQEPIRREVFDNRGYASLFDLLAIHKTQDPSVLENTEEAEDRRATIFEEYANAGLIMLEEETKGSVDLTEELALKMSKLAESAEKDEPHRFDITDLVD